ncbi:MAG: DUF58 domain-containing protein [Clostridiales bacterium]|nr:DUF58 domain-containing protein [Clostridiales bacterium]MBR5416547.1 DUF58 domain-containing protein [Clostridiales bacterium]
MKLIVFLILLVLLTGVELLLYRKRALSDLSFHVSFSRPIARCGDIIEVIEVAQNNKRLPLPFVLLKFESPDAFQFLDMSNTSVSDLFYREDMLTMKPFSRHTRRIKVRCAKRGLYSFVRVNVSTSDLLLLEKITHTFNNDASITILPEKITPPEMQTLLSVSYSDLLARRTPLTDPMSFAGIREYRPEDPMRDINWTATAKAGDFMVNQTTSTCHRQVSIFVNLESYNLKDSVALLEKSISLAYSYMIELGNLGIPSRIFTNGKDISTGSPVTDILASDAPGLLRRGIALARIDLSAGVIPFSDLVEEYLPATGTDDYVIVISPRYKGLVQDTLRSIRARRDSLLWVMPAFRTTPEVENATDITGRYLRWEVKGNDR